MNAVIVGYARTPFVKFNGVFAQIPATELGAHAISAALTAAGVDASAVEMVFAGQVLQGAAGQNPARQSAVAAGIPLTTPAITLNAVCLSGMEAVVSAVRLINAGEADIVVAAGQESMTLAPHAWSGSRAGKKYGAIEFIDTMEHDGLTDAFEKRSMGVSTEERNGSLSLSRADQDAWAARSHQTLAAGAEFLQGEIAPFTIAGRKGDTVVSADDGLRADTTVETLAKLRPAFGSSGTITAGSSSQITDGAAAIVLMSAAAAARLGLTPIAEVLAHAFVAGPDVTLHAQPANAITAALARTSRPAVGRASGATDGVATPATQPYAAADLAAVEINEAFAAVSVHSTRMLGIAESIVNANGGAIALGHPIGASGTRIVGHLARRLAALGPGSLGAAGICGGGGQGAAVILRSL